MTKKLPEDVVLLGWVSFFNDVSSEMIYPLLPLFTVVVLKTSATSLGWVEGVAQATVALLTAWIGLRSDRFRRRAPYIQLGYGLPLAGKAVLAVAVAWPMVMLGRVIDRVGKGIRSAPRDALIADVTPKEDRGRAFGLHRAMDSAGAVVGILLSAFLLWWFTGTPAKGETTSEQTAASFRIIFGIAAGLGLIALVFTFKLRDRPHEEHASAAPADHKLSRGYWIVLALLLVFSLANSSDAFLLLRAVDLGLAPWEVVLLYAVMSVVYMVGSYPAGILSDRIGRWPMIAIGWAVYAIVYGLLACTGSIAIWPLLALYGIQLAITDGVGKALLVDHAPKDRRGFALGIFYMATSATTLAASVIAGVLWDRVDSDAPFWFGAAVAAFALVLVLVLRPWRRA